MQAGFPGHTNDCGTPKCDLRANKYSHPNDGVSRFIADSFFLESHIDACAVQYESYANISPPHPHSNH